MIKFRTERFYRRVCPAFLWQFLLFSSLFTNFPVDAQVESSYKEEFQLRGKLRVALNDNLSPLAFRDSAGNLIGFEVDLAREIAKELLGDSNAVEFVVVSNRDRISYLVENKVDLAIAQISLTANRSRLVDFSLPYYRDRTVLIAQSLTSTMFKQVGILKNSTAIAAIQSIYPKAEIIGASTYRELIEALEQNQVQAIAGDYLPLANWLQANPKYFLVGQPLDFHSLAIAIPKGLQHKRLFLGTIQAINKLRQNNWLNQKATEWKLPLSP